MFKKILRFFKKPTFAVFYSKIKKTTLLIFQKIKYEFYERKKTIYIMFVSENSDKNIFLDSNFSEKNNDDSIREYISSDNNTIIIETNNWVNIKNLLKKKHIRGLMLVFNIEEFLTEKSDNILNFVSDAEKIKRIFKIPVNILINNFHVLYGFQSFFSFPEDTTNLITLQLFTKENLRETVKNLYAKLRYDCFRKLDLAKTDFQKCSIFHFPEQFHRFLIKINAVLTKLKFNKCFKSIYFLDFYNRETQEKIFIEKNGQITKFILNDYKKETLKNNILSKIIYHREFKKSSYKKKIVYVVISLFLLSSWFFVLKYIEQKNADLIKETMFSAQLFVEEFSDNQISERGHFRNLMDLYQSKQLLVEKSGLFKNLGLSRNASLLSDIDRIIAFGIEKYFLKSEAQYLEGLLKKDNKQPDYNTKKNYYSDVEAYLTLCYPLHTTISERAALIANRWFYPETSIKTIYGLMHIYLSKLFYFNEDFLLRPWQCRFTFIKKFKNPFSLNKESENIWSVLKPESKLLLGDRGLKNLINEKLFYSNNKISNMYLNQFRNNVRKIIRQKVYQINKYNDPITKTAWNEDSNKRLIDKLLDDYQEDNFKAWRLFLLSIRMKPFRSFPDAAKKLNTISENINSIINLSSKSLNLNKSLKNIDLGLYSKGIRDLKKDLLRLNSENDIKKYISDFLNQKNEINHFYAVVENINFISDKFPSEDQKIIKHLLLQPVERIWDLFVKRYGLFLQKTWIQTVWPIYQQNIQHKFPFEIVTQEANISEIYDFFDEKSPFEKFIYQHLLILDEDQAFSKKETSNFSLDLSPLFLKQLNIAKIIRNLFFKKTGFSFEVYPIPLKNITSTRININDQNLTYKNGPQRWKKFYWNFQEVNQEVRVNITSSAKRSNPIVIRFIGPFAIFRFLQKALVKYVGNNTYQVIWVFHYHHKPINLKLLFRVTKNQDFIKLLLQGFRLPREIFNPN